MLTRLRLFYAFMAVLLIFVGLTSRRFVAIPCATGDCLWAMMVFCCYRFLLVQTKLPKVAAISLLTAYVVEFAQLIRWPWLVQLRSTTLGHLVLGQGFLWTDLVAYTVGVALIYLACRLVERKF